MTASLLQPLVGLYTDRRPQPYSLPLSMGCTLLGIVTLAFAPSFPVLLAGGALLGIGSAIFHPEIVAPRPTGLGGRPRAGTVLFPGRRQCRPRPRPAVGGVRHPARGQSSLAWFALVALVGMGVLVALGRWYKSAGHARLTKPKSPFGHATLPRSQVRRAITVLIALIFSKFFYLASITSYYIFYLMHRFNLSTETSQIYLFVFLAAAAAGTFIGGPIGDRFGRESHLGLNPGRPSFHACLTLCRLDGDISSFLAC